MHEVTGPSIVWLFICFDRTHHTVMTVGQSVTDYLLSVNITHRPLLYIINLILLDPPKPPKVVVVPNVLSLNVTWFSSIEDNSIKIYDYLVKVVDYVSNTLVQEYKKVKETSLVINKLMKNRTYFVAIQARNEVGYGKPSNVSATTLLAGTIKTVLRMSIDASLSNDGHLFWLHFLSYFQLSKILFIFKFHNL